VEEEEVEAEEQEVDAHQVANKPVLMVRKNDFIVWLGIGDMQQKLYESFLTTDDVKLVLNETKSPLAAITVMKKICDHPMLLHKKMKTIRDIELPSFEILASLTSVLLSCVFHPLISYMYLFRNEAHSEELERIVDQSGKLAFLIKLLANLKKEGHRPLIFSQSTKMLDIIEAVLSRKVK